MDRTSPRHDLTPDAPHPAIALGYRPTAAQSATIRRALATADVCDAMTLAQHARLLSNLGDLARSLLAEADDSETVSRDPSLCRSETARDANSMRAKVARRLAACAVRAAEHRSALHHFARAHAFDLTAVPRLEYVGGEFRWAGRSRDLLAAIEAWQAHQDERDGLSLRHPCPECGTPMQLSARGDTEGDPDVPGGVRRLPRTAACECGHAQAVD